jgi:heptosyltransferase-1
VKRILVIKLSALGDLFHAVPVVHLLSNHFGCKVDWVTQPEYVDLVSCHSDVDRVISFPRKGGLKESQSFLRELRIRKYDLALDLQGLTKSGLVLGLCRSKRKIGSSHPREASSIFANERPQARADSVHAMEILLDSLLHLGIDPQPIVYPLQFPSGPDLPRGSGPVIALAPRSRWPAKDWPEAHFIDLGAKLIQEKNADLWILGGPDDERLGDRMRAALGEKALNLCGKHSLLSLGPILKQADVLVSNDSGPMHFAVAVGTPLVALFGPTDPSKTGPWGEGHCVLRAQPGEDGYPDHRSYKNGDARFISTLTVDEVYLAVQQQLET